MALETLAVRLAVERASVKDINEIRQVHISFVKANEKKDKVRLIMLDELFHTKIMEFTRNRLLVNINAQLLEAFRVYRSESFTDENVYNNAIEPHARILACFENHDPKQAVEEMRRHLNITTYDMEQIHKRNNDKQEDTKRTETDPDKGQNSI